MLQSASKSFAIVAIVTMKNFEVSICSSIVQYGTVIYFHFIFLRNNQTKIAIFINS